MNQFSRREAARVVGLGAAMIAAGSGKAATLRINEGYALDHVVWTVPDLEEGVALIAELTGVKPVSGGHGLNRTQPHNALISLGGGSYLEIFSPLRAFGEGGKWTDLVADGRPHVASHAFRVEDRFKKLLSAFPVSGISHTPAKAMGRVRPDGGRLDWELIHLEGSALPVLPFFIDWLGSKPHPSLSSPQGVTIKRFEVVHPQAEEIRRIYKALGVTTPVIHGDKPSVNLELRGLKGTVLLSS